jgi:hypothetical protein
MPPSQHGSVSPTAWSCAAPRAARCSFADGELNQARLQEATLLGPFMGMVAPT